MIYNNALLVYKSCQNCQVMLASFKFAFLNVTKSLIHTYIPVTGFFQCLTINDWEMDLGNITAKSIYMYLVRAVRGL